MTEIDQNTPPDNGESPVDTHFEDNLSRFSSEAAHRIVRDDTQHNERDWQPVKTNRLSTPITTNLERELISEQAADVISNESHRKKQDEKIAELEQNILLDERTGLHTKEVLKEDIRHSIDQARREGAGVGLIKLDIKSLKKVNDEISEMAGDELIVSMARACGVNVRSSDKVYRGGKDSDEFYILLSLVHEGEEEGAVLLDKRIKKIDIALRELVKNSPSIPETLEEDWIGFYAGTSYIDLKKHNDTSESTQDIADRLFAEADSDFRFEKKRAKSEAVRRLKEKGEEVPADERLV